MFSISHTSPKVQTSSSVTFTPFHFWCCSLYRPSSRVLLCLLSPLPCILQGFTRFWHRCCTGCTCVMVWSRVPIKDPRVPRFIHKPWYYWGQCKTWGLGVMHDTRSTVDLLSFSLLFCLILVPRVIRMDLFYQALPAPVYGFTESEKQWGKNVNKNLQDC